MIFIVQQLAEEVLNIRLNNIICLHGPLHAYDSVP